MAGSLRPKTLKVYYHDDFARITTGLKIASCMIAESHVVVDEQSVLKRLSALTLNGPSDGNACSCCGIGPFESRQQQITHYKQHWHTHNLKRKLFGKTPLSLGQFNSRADDNSSVSGSDSEEESANKPNELFANATRHCKAFFSNKDGQVVCVYRCILHHRKEELSTDGDGSAWVQRMTGLSRPGAQRWAVLMMSGGHFAGAIFTGGTPVLHKTFHSYTTRRGQGQAQATRDQHGNAPKSAGSNLRRYNQTKFLEHVQEIITSWTEDLQGCSLILYRAVGPINQGVLFGKNSPITKEDLRVRQLPFPTRKPTYKEVQRVHETVSSLEIYDSMELFQKALMASKAKPANKSSSDTSIEQSKKSQKSPTKLDRAKSRERVARPLPTTQMSSEDEGPCYIDSETPKDWIKTLSEQASNGKFTNSRKDLLLDGNKVPQPKSDSEDDSKDIERKEVKKKKKKENKKEESKLVKKKEEDTKPVKKNEEDSKMVKDNREDKPLKKAPPKITANVKKIWTAISEEKATLDTILESWDGEGLPEACNVADPADGNTALHKAALAASPDMVTVILGAGGDPCVKNNLLQTPYACTPHADTRLAFRLFQAQFPDKYNYGKSQIPGPLTPEMLEQERERKAQQKRAKRQREKEKQVEKAKTNKFLQLDDKDKLNAVEKRCFVCALPLPKQPFEYNSYQFCSIQCLKNHRSLRPLAMSV